MAQVLFRAFFNNTVHEELGITDGTFGGTQLVLDIHTGAASSMSDSISPQFTEMGGKVYFQAYTDNTVPDLNRELWVTDGTVAGTMMVKDINPGDANASPVGLMEFNDLLFFGADDGVSGFEPWVSDGTELGTFRLADINTTLGASSNAFGFGGTLTSATELFFTASDGTTNEIWKTDGTLVGTAKLADGSLQNAVLAGDNIFVPEFSAGTGSEFAIINTTTGSKQIIDIISGSDSSNASQFVALGNQVIFVARDSALNANNELWTSDGTALGTVLLKEINPDATLGSSPALSAGIEFNGEFLFTANGGTTTGFELWATDGTTVGTRLVKDIATGESSPGNPNSGSPQGFIQLGSEVLFTANDQTGNGSTLWKTDGTTAGTVEVATVNASPLTTEGQFAVAGDKLFFADNSQMYVTDGTTAGTIALDVNRTGFKIEELTAYGNGVIFRSETSSSLGEELYYSDGTDAGTGLVRNIRPGSDDADPTDFFVFGDLRFTGFDDTVTLDDTGETVDGLSGNDTITGGIGNDDITGSNGNDTIDGGAGDDTLGRQPVRPGHREFCILCRRGDSLIARRHCNRRRLRHAGQLRAYAGISIRRHTVR